MRITYYSKLYKYITIMRSLLIKENILFSSFTYLYCSNTRINMSMFTVAIMDDINIELSISHCLP